MYLSELFNNQMGGSFWSVSHSNMVYIKRERIVDTNWYVSRCWIYSCISIRKQAVLNRPWRINTWHPPQELSSGTRNIWRNSVIFHHGENGLNELPKSPCLTQKWRVKTTIAFSCQWTNLPNLYWSLYRGGNTDNNRLKEPYSSLKSSSWE